MDIGLIIPIDEFNAIMDANAPSDLNVFATIADITAPVGDVSLSDGANIIFKEGVNTSTVGSTALTGNQVIDFPDASGTVALTSDLGSSEWSSYTGTRAGGTLVATLGDYDSSGNGTRVTISDNDEEIVLHNGPSAAATWAQGDLSLNLGNASYSRIIFPSTGFNGTLRVNSLSALGAGRTWDLPDATGTVALTSDLPGVGDGGIYEGNGTIPTGTIASMVDTIQFGGTNDNIKLDPLNNSIVFSNQGVGTQTGTLVGDSGSTSSHTWTLPAGKTGTIALTGTNIESDTGTGITIAGGTTEKLGFFGVTPVVQQTALTTQLTTITFTAPTVADYALQDVTNTTPYGFVDAEELRTFISVVENLQVRMAEVETREQALGFYA